MPTSSTRHRVISWFKPLVWLACLYPVATLAAGAFRGDLGTDPVETISHTTGLAALTLLFVTLSVTPIRRLTGFHELIRLRRLLGLFAFFYAALHVLDYAVFDQSLSPALIAEDVAKHPWVLLGATAFVMLLALALTSTTGWIRRLGGRRWNRLHRLIYLAAPLGVVHFYLSVKLDVSQPLLYGAILSGLLVVRVLVRRRRAAPASPHHAALLPAREQG